MNILELVEKQKQYFNQNNTKDIHFRKEMLQKLKKAIQANETKIYEALKIDLHKLEAESYMTEVGMVLSELSHAIKHVRNWSKVKSVYTPLAQFHAKSFEKPEPYGIAFIIAPWNYPFMLAIDPLIGAIAAGNCAILKTSEYAVQTSKILKEMIQSNFQEEYISVIEGGVEETTELLRQKVDYIFFTGGTNIGQIVMQEAAKQLIPVTLELGGKSPCMIDKTANIALAAKRIAFGKLLNAGQTCVAPDYLLIQKDIKDEFLKQFQKYITKFLGENPLLNKEYAHIINEKHFKRLKGYLKEQKVVMGGGTNEKALTIEPTIIEVTDFTTELMQEEIFGPILPIITFYQIEEAINLIKEQEKPLALYLFTTDKKTEKRILENISFGGGCINDTIIHLASNHLRFGGVGKSGMGSYHGKHGFDTFSHYKSIVKKYNWIDMPMRYMPYTNLKLKIIKLFLK